MIGWKPVVDGRWAGESCEQLRDVVVVQLTSDVQTLRRTKNTAHAREFEKDERDLNVYHKTKKKRLSPNYSNQCVRQRRVLEEDKILDLNYCNISQLF